MTPPANISRALRKGFRNPGNSRKSGFALVVTLSLMILLTVIVVGLLSISAVSLRTSGQSSALQQARANARLAMMLAIGELQTQMGPDQRISADAAILDTAALRHPHWMGAWNSWHAGASTGVDPASEHRTIKGAANRGMAATYDTNRKDHFRSWLVSLPPSEAGDISTARNLSLNGLPSPTKSSTAVQLVGKGSLGTASDPKEFVNTRLISVASKSGPSATGRYGWWVGDESQKARIVGDSYEISQTAPQSLAENIFRHQAPGSTGTKSVPGLAKLIDESQLTRAPSRLSLALVSGATAAVSTHFHDVTPYSYQVLSDVREGGLKRDLSTLLERPISAGETSDPFMLYRFDTAGQEAVPIQDLAAYYQLYRNKGTLYASNVLSNGIQVTSPNFQNGAGFAEEYSSLYRLPVPVKIQFLLSLTSSPRTPGAANSDTDMLHIGITPSATLWNPYNVPLVMNYGDPASSSSLLRFFNLPFTLKWKKNGAYSPPTGVSLGNLVDDPGNAFSLYFSGMRSITFEPGEVRVFSLAPSPGLVALKNLGTYQEELEVSPGWNPNAFLKMPRSATKSQFESDPAGKKEAQNYDKTGKDYSLSFKATDSLSFSLTAADSNSQLSNGSALQFFMRQSVMRQSIATESMARQYQVSSRMGGDEVKTLNFNKELMRKGFPGGVETLDFPARPVSDLIGKPPVPFLLFTLAAGCETSETANTGNAAGRQFVSRPFLHSTAITGTSFIDRVDGASLYQNGWNWSVTPINNASEVNVAVNAKNQGYYGGGYTAESGATHIVQQEVPVAPPISIAALSHAHLGGFSLAREALGPMASNSTENFQRTTASGQGGLFPRTLQAIGNSYAHPYLKPDEAFGAWTREFSEDIPDRSATFADHSYLANKALWDDYFFSSITPANTDLFKPDSSSTSLVAQRFFFEEKPLPNRRLTPYINNFDEAELKKLLTTTNQAADGFADRIASRLMVEGAFNVNSTSVSAWKTFFSSLKGKKISYLDKDTALTAGVKLGNETSSGMPVSSFSLPNGKSYQGSKTDPADEAQWSDWRSITDAEINELATAMVKQVKLRGPFLSLSEFVNRRLDSSNRELSLKGALQAALDDPAVSINSGFRTPDRMIKSSETAGMNPAFKEALEGPVAYGSAAYVDQADVLRNCAELLAPRGDTFVIRSYGDALDASGNVQARAWCEALVQRVPEYLSEKDQDHLKQSDLTDPINKKFGRKFKIVTLRFLSESEV